MFVNAQCFSQSGVQKKVDLSPTLADSGHPLDHLTSPHLHISRISVQKLKNKERKIDKFKEIKSSKSFTIAKLLNYL